MARRAGEVKVRFDGSAEDPLPPKQIRYLRVHIQLSSQTNFNLQWRRQTLHSLLSILIKEYDERVYSLPPADPLRTLKYLMDQRNLRPVDLLPVFGSRAHVSMALNGKRAFSKEQIRKLAEFFRTSTDLFI